MPKTSDSKKRWIAVPLAALGVAALLAAGLTSDAQAEAQAGAQDSDVLARVGSVDITRDTVEQTLASELQRLEQERYTLLERGLEAAIETELVNLEAAERDMSRDELLDEVYGEIAEPTDEAIDAFYESNKSRINQPKEQISGQIADYLKQVERQQVYQTFIGELKERYEVARLLEPLRTEVADADYAPTTGKAGAAVRIVEFSDFQCPYCQRLAPTLDQVMEEYGDRVELVFRQFPLDIHAEAQKAAEASLCAGDQGKFWEMHDRMFEDIRALGVDQLKASAAGLGLDTDKFGECLDSGKYEDQVKADLVAGQRAGVTGTPTFFINGRFLSGAQPYEAIAAIIEDELARAASK